MAFPKVDHNELLNNIRYFAKKNGLTLVEVATLAGLSAGAIYSWKKHTPTIGTLKEVANVLGTNYHKLIDKHGVSKQTAKAQKVDLAKVINKKSGFEYAGHEVTPEQLRVLRGVFSTMFEKKPKS